MANNDTLLETNDQVIAKESLCESIHRILNPQHVILFLIDPEVQGYKAWQANAANEINHQIIPQGSEIPMKLESAQKILHIQEILQGSTGRDEGIALVKDMGSEILAPITKNNVLLGWAALGVKDQKDPYTENDRLILTTLTQQFSLAYQVANAIGPLLNKNEELEILNRIALAIDKNKDFDSLLSSLFKQLQGIFDIDCFSLVMKTEGSESFLRLFLQEQNSTVISTNQPQPLGSEAVEELAMSSGKVETVTNGTSWLVIPLRKDEKLIGTISLGNSRQKDVFTDNNETLLNVIASLVSGAIIKADQTLEEQIEELHAMEQICQKLNTAHEINIALTITLQAALDNTHATMGSIGLVDKTFEYLDRVINMSPNQANPIAVDRVRLDHLPWLTRKFIKPEIVEESNWTEFLGIPQKCKWHYLNLLDLDDGQYALLSLHLDSPGLLKENDIDFLEQLKIQAEIALKNALLYEELHNAIQAKNEFIGFISHELKNPLTVIKGYSDILQKGMAGDINDEQKDYLKTISHNVRRMNTFITDLADQSHIETKSLRLTFESISVQNVINDILQTYEAQIIDKSIQIKSRVREPIAKVWCDRGRIIQILSNLLSNAIKYTPALGKVEIGAEQIHNEWDHEGAAEVIHFWVMDDGLGISADDQAQIFGKFYRGTNPQILKIPGSGLGLRISKSLTEMMGGKMWFTSTKGEGSTFHFTLPI